MITLFSKLQSKLKTFSLICTLLIISSLNSFTGLTQTNITVGTGTTTQIYPFGNYYGYERSASIYTAAEVGSTGNITKVAWYCNTGDKGARLIVIRLKMTTSTAFPATPGNWATEIAGTTSSYSASYTPVFGWNTITLTTPFTYTGNNLEVLVEANFGGSGNGEGVAGNAVRYSAATEKHAYWRADTDAPTGNGNRTNNRPNIQLTIVPLACSGAPTPGITSLTPNTGAVSSSINGAVSGSNPSTESGLTYQWQYSDDGNAPWTNITGQTSVILSTTAKNTSGTRYYRRAITCSGLTSHSTPAIYTTYVPSAACNQTVDHNGADWTVSSNTIVSGKHINIGNFTVNSGVTATIETGCPFEVEAINIDIKGTIDGEGKGYAGGSGGSLGQLWAEGGHTDGQGITQCWDKDNAKELRLYGGVAGTNGAGTGKGNGGATAAHVVGIKQDCNAWTDYGGRIAGAGGAGGGKGGSYAGIGGDAGNGGGGGTETGCAIPNGTSDSPSSGGIGSSAGGGTYGNTTTYSLEMGSGGGGAGGGGRGPTGATSGGSGGSGGGLISLKACHNLTLGATAVIKANGTPGGKGGNGGNSHKSPYCCNDASPGCDEQTYSGAGGGGAGGGGGSGGTILLVATGDMKLLSGSKLFANGGNGGNGGTKGTGEFFFDATDGARGGGGGGGRIKIFNNPCGNNTMLASKDYSGGTGNASGGIGTLYESAHPNYVTFNAGNTTTASYTVCHNTNPTTAINASAATGGLKNVPASCTHSTPDYDYQWYVTKTACSNPTTGGNLTPNSGWFTVTGATGQNLTAAQELAGINQVGSVAEANTYCFQRRTKSGECYGWTSTVSVTIRPDINITITGNSSLCLGTANQSVTITNNNNIAVTVTYTINGGSNQTVNIGANSNTLIPQSTATVATYTYNLVSAVYQTTPTCTKALSGSLAVNVNPNPSATLTTANSTICHGNPVTLGGVVYNVPATSSWTLTLSDGSIVTGSSGGISGVPWTTTLTPNSTTTYTISSIQSTTSGCTVAGTGSTTVTLPTKSGLLAVNGESATCPVSGTNWVDFYHPTTGNLIGSVNANGGNLGNVTLVTGINTGGSMFACNTGNNPQYETAYMGRNWHVNSSAYPNSGDFSVPGRIRLPYSDPELANMNSRALTTTGNPLDDNASPSHVMLTKISNGTVDGNPTNDCNATILGVSQIASNTIASVYTGMTTSGSYADFTVAQFSEMFLHKNINNASPLPVTLISFSATCDKDVAISWTTASEQNSDRFIIEKSRDLQNWLFVAEQTAAGNSNTVKNYTQIDQNNWNGVTYYRLRQVDFNGEEAIYGPISVSCIGNDNNMSVYPNPNNGSFTVEITSDETHADAQLLLTDVTGKVIYSQKVNVEIGTTQVLLNDLEIEVGTYLVSLRTSNSGMKQLRPVKVMVKQ